MNISKFVSKLASLGIRLWLENGKLCYQAPKGSITPTLSDEITLLKPELLAMLANKLSAPISPSSRNEPIPLSFGQQLFWLHDQLRPGNPAYNILCPVKLIGHLHKYFLARAINTVVTRHEILRTIILNTDNKLEQRILSDLHIELPIYDLSHLPKHLQSKESKRLIKAEARHPFKLATGPLLRTKLLTLASDQHVVTITLHHSITDGWSMNLLKREIAICYDAIFHAQANPLPPLPIQYADYACWQRQQLKGDALDRLLVYWRKQLHDAPPLLALPTDHARTTSFTHRGSTYPLHIDSALSTRLHQLAQHHSASLHMVLLAALAVLLSRYSGQNDLCVGTPIANRQRIETENLIGYFVNTLVLRIRLRPNLTFTELLQQVRNTALDAYEHQDLPFEYLVEQLAPVRSLHHHPLFQVMLIMQNTPADLVQVESIHLEDYNQHPGTTKFDLTIALQESSGDITGLIEYNTDLFTPETISRLGQNWVQLLASIASKPLGLVGTLEILKPQEQLRMLVDWNATRQPEPLYETVHGLFEQQVVRTPHAIALIAGRQHLSYTTLNVRANQLAHTLRSQGVGPEQRIGVCLTRGLNQIIAILGILKAGAAYTPLDPNLPSKRRNLIAQDSALTLILIEQSNDKPTHINLPGVPVLDLGKTQPLLTSQPTSNPNHPIHPDNLAYLIYTSGSTGKPKGVMGLHRACVNRFNWMWQRYPFQPGERYCQKTALSFVDSVWEIFGPLLQGIPSVLITESTVLDTEGFLDQLQRQAISRIVLVPSLLKTLLTGDVIAQSLRRLKIWTCSGEHLSNKLVQRFYSHLPDATLINLYGSTEVAADVTYNEASAESVPVLVGRPVYNVRVYVLDNHGSPAPCGVRGELYVGGSALARGYFARAAETAEKFVPDPFSHNFGERLYRTGDHAAWTEDGQLQLFGRRDRQLQIKGIRIEPGAIETQLRTHPDLKDAVVILHTSDNEHDTLIGYLVAKHKGDIPSTSELVSFLHAHLPHYAIPHKYIYLDTLPITLSGKLDRLALPLPDSIPSISSHVAPRDTFEALLVQIWEETLNIRPISIRDDFFELGGNSFLAVRLIERIHQRVGPLLTLPDLYKESTIGYWRDTLELKMQKIWIDVLDVQNIKMDDNLYDFGADDLKTVRLLNRIKKDIGVDLTMFDIFETSIFHKLIEFIQTRYFNEGISQTNVTTLPCAHRSTVKVIAPGIRKTSLFIVTPFGGLLPAHSSVSIENLGQHFSPEQSAYTLLPPPASQNAIELFVKLYEHLDQPDFLQHIDICTWRPDALAIQRMAAHCIQDMKNVQPMGPYLLAGYSSGGVVAFEMAQQLTNQGEQVGFVALMDTLSPKLASPDKPASVIIDTDIRDTQEIAWFVTRAFGGAAKFRFNYQSMVDVLRSIESDKRWDYVLTQLKAKNIVPHDTALKELQQIYRTYKIYRINSWILNETLVRYMPRKYSGQVILLRATEAYQEQADKSLGWQKFIEDPIIIHNLPGDHATFLWPDKLPYVAQVLENCLKTHSSLHAT